MDKVILTNKLGQKIVGLFDLPNNKNKSYAAVLVLHGFGGNKENSVCWTNILNPLGIATLRIDFRGTGESDGQFEDKTISNFVDDAKIGLDYLSNSPNININKLGLIGYSAGAFTSILVAASEPRLSTLLSAVPGTQMDKIIANLYTKDDLSKLNELGYVENMIDSSKRRINKTFFEDAKKYNLLTEAKKFHMNFWLSGQKWIK